MKKEFVHLRPSDFPRDVEIEIILINPSECYNKFTSRVGYLVCYKAYFPKHGNKRVFDVVFPVKKLQNALLKFQKEDLEIKNRSVYMKFMYHKNRIIITEYKLI